MKKNNIPVIWSLLIFSFVLRLFLANFGTLELDQGTFISWANQLVQGGLRNFYFGWSDYLPGYLYLLWLLGKINAILPSLQTITFKLPAILADVVTGFLIYKIVKKQKNEKWAIFSSAIYVFNPAILANSTFWGQVDSITTLFSLLSIYFFSHSVILSSVFLSIGTLIKPQAAFILPAILYLFFINKKKFIELLNYCIIGLLVFVISFIPFNNTDNLFGFIFQRLSLSASQYPYGSVNAFSFWGFFGFWKPDNFVLWIGMFLSIVIIVAVTTFMILKKKKNMEYLIAGVSFLTTFLFMTRMHERHLLPALVFILLSQIKFLPSILFYIGFSITYLANVVYAYIWITKDFKEIFNPIFVKALITFNLSSLFLFLTSVFNEKIKLFLTKVVQYKYRVVKESKLFLTKDISRKATTILLSLILFFSLFTRLFMLGNPKDEYFDEVYHVFTAKLMLHNDPKAWEWWNPHPEGFAYEWTHPPIAKLGMALGMKIFGESAFGSRIIQAILGTLSVLLIYGIVFQIFKDRKTGLISAFILSLDGLFLVMNRIGMNDTYVVFFMLSSYFFFLKEKNLFSAILFGFAISSKWSAIYFLPILAISHFVFKRKFTLGYLWFLVIPPAIYILSYLQMFLTGHTWDQFVEVQRQMWWYHTNLDAEHPYTSPAWSWPILARPIYLYNGSENNGLVERIYAFGNPAIFWFGLWSFMIASYFSWKEKIKRLGLVIFSYLIFFIPWIASPRIMFLYHYMPSIPFLSILIGFVLRRFPKLITYYLLFVTIMFIYFYPHWTGLQIPEWLDRSYYWFSSWR